LEAHYKQRMLCRAEECFRVLLDRRDQKLRELSHLENHALNPLLDTHKSIYLFGDDTDENLARSLIYPSIIGTGLNTSFGDIIQKEYLVDFDNVNASGIKGLDIEFTHAITKQHIYCQLKAGVNTINSGDVNPILEKFTKAIRLIRDNGGEAVPNERFIVGVFSGQYERRNGNYKRIEQKSTHRVLVGQDFWEAVTGDKLFYSDLAAVLTNFQRAHSNSASKVERAVKALAAEIKKSRR